jgi:hypothetical protein
MKDRLEILIEMIKRELIQKYDQFHVKIIQLFYDDNYESYMPVKEEDITNQVAI